MNPEQLQRRLYLGDGAYVGQCPQTGLIWLYTHNGLGVVDKVGLEPEVLETFLMWVKANGLELDE